MKKRHGFLFFILCIAVLPAASEPVYLTFVSSNGNGPIDKSLVTLRLDETNIPVSELVYVDTANRSQQILAHPGGRRLYIFVYDFLFSTPESLLQARKTTEAFIAKIDPNDLIAIAGINGKDGLKMYCMPATDRSKVIAGLNWIGQKKVEGMMEGPEGNLYPEEFSAINRPSTLIPDANFLQNIKTYAIREKDKDDARPVLLQSLADLGFLLSSLDGRKHIILFSPGTDTGGLSINLPLRDRKPKKKRPVNDQPVEIEHEDYDSIIDTSVTREKGEKRMAALGRKKGPKQSGETLPELVAGTDAHVHIFHPGGQEHGLFKNLASRTGGNFIIPGTDLNSAIDRILSSDRIYYVVRSEANTEKMKDLNTVTLEVQGREIIGSNRWLVPKNVANYTTQEKKARIAQNIYTSSGPPPAGYRFWSDFALDQNVSRIPSFVQIDGKMILQNKEDLVDLEFFGFSTDQKGAVLDSAYFIFTLDLKNKSLQEKLKSTGVKIWTVLLSNMEPATVNWTIVNLQTNEMLDYSVPIEGIARSMTMSNPFFPALNLNWIVWPAPSTTDIKRGVEVGYPYREGTDMFFFPDISPVLKKTVDGQVFYLKVFNLTSANKIPSVRVSLIDSNGKSNEVKTLGLLQNPTPIQPNGMGLFWRLATLPNVPAGDYRLKVSTVDPVRNQEIIRELKTYVQ